MTHSTPGALSTDVAFPADAADQPVATTPSTIPPAPLSSVRAVRTTNDYGRREDLIDRARAIIVLRLSEGSTTVDDLAQILQVSSRTLQRRLQERNQSVSRLVDDSRREIVYLMLASGASMKTIATRSGFGDVPAFYRAFRRWTGTTPGRYKRNNAAAKLIAQNVAVGE
jgi:AraC-like DNA-binding protein